MATLCKEVDEKIRVVLENEEIKDITNAIDILIRRFAESVCEFNKDIKVDRLELCGSMAEGTRIWEPEVNSEYDLEFDYIAVMKEWPGYGKFSFIPSFEEGKMQIECEVIDQQSVPGNYPYLRTAIKWTFKNMVLKCIREQCERHNCTRQLSGLVNVPGCPHCTVDKKTGSLRWYDKPSKRNIFFSRKSVLYFVWSSRKQLVSNPLRKTRLNTRSPDPTLEDTLQIKVDFHPVIEVNKEMIAWKADGTMLPLEEDFTYFLFPHDVNSFDWRISAYHEEVKMFTDASEKHKLAFCVLKFIACAFTFNGVILAYPYEIKCIALNHLKSCQTPSRGAQECSSNMIKDLQNCAQLRKLPHPILGSCDLYCMNRIFNSVLSPQIKHLRKTLFSLFDQISLKDLYCDIETILSLNTKYEITKNEKLFDDFLKKRRQASAQAVLEKERGFPLCNKNFGGWWTL